MSKAIKFILQELKNNREDRDRFNKATFELYVEDNVMFWNPLFGNSGIDNLHDQQIINLIRTALSRIDGKAVLSALDDVQKELYQNPEVEEALNSSFAHHVPTVIRLAYARLDCIADKLYQAFDTPLRSGEGDCIADKLYQAFDTPLQSGEGLEKALKALDQYFVEEGEIVKLNFK
jgi:hypothetical protein